MGAKTSKNFITTNAVNNIMTVPKKPAANYVDTATGARQELEVENTSRSLIIYYEIH
jgi:hypothetical protein